MTTIAYRDGVVASDSLSTSHQLRDDHGPKIYRVGKAIVAAAGSRPLCLKFRDWVAGGMKGECPFEGKDEGNGLIVTAEHVVCWGEFGPWPVRSPFYALGSGYQIAMGAMALGADPRRAVAVAIDFDTGSGGQIQVLSLT